MDMVCYELDSVAVELSFHEYCPTENLLPDRRPSERATYSRNR